MVHPFIFCKFDKMENSINEYDNHFQIINRKKMIY